MNRYVPVTKHLSANAFLGWIIRCTGTFLASHLSRRPCHLIVQMYKSLAPPESRRPLSCVGTLPFLSSSPCEPLPMLAVWIPYLSIPHPVSRRPYWLCGYRTSLAPPVSQRPCWLCGIPYLSSSSCEQAPLLAVWVPYLSSSSCEQAPLLAVWLP